MRNVPLVALILSVFVSPAFAQYNVGPPASCASGYANRWDSTISAWSCDNVGGGGIPAGLITFVVTGSCPSGWTEVTALAGKTLFGTLNANADVGTTGGNDTITPTGTVAAPVFTGSAGTVPAQTFTGSSSTVAAQTFTGSSSTVAAQTISWPAGVPTNSGGALSWPAGVPAFTGTPSSVIVNHVHKLSFARGATTGGATTTQGFTTSTDTSSTAITDSTDNPTGGASSYTPAGSVAWPVGVPTISTEPTLSWPAGVPTNGTSTVTPLGTNSTSTVTPLGTNGTASFTPAGTNSAPAFTGSSFDNRSAFVRVIFCSKN